MTTQQAVTIILLNQPWQIYSTGSGRRDIPWDTLPPLEQLFIHHLHYAFQRLIDPIKYPSDLYQGLRGFLKLPPPLLCSLPKTMHANSLTAPYNIRRQVMPLNHRNTCRWIVLLCTQTTRHKGCFLENLLLSI